MGKYQEFVPAPRLSRYIECYWSREDSEGTAAHRVLPDGCVDILFSAHQGQPNRGKPQNGVMVVLYSSDLRGLQKKIEEAGGKIVKPVFSFPGGQRFHFTDPSGNELAVWSDAP